MTRTPLTGAELRFAAQNQIPVYYEEKYLNPEDKHLTHKGKCVMTKAPKGYYIGNSDINPDDFENNQLVQGEFPEGSFRVSKIARQNYQAPIASK